MIERKIIFISDINPDVEEFIAHMNDPRAERRENNELSERAIFYHLEKSDVQIVVVTAKPVPESFITYIRKLFPKSNFTVVTPRGWGNIHQDISQALMDDPYAMSQILGYKDVATKIFLDCYSVSKHFYLLLEEIAKGGVTTELLTVDEKHSGIVNKVGTKSGLRELWEQNKFSAQVQMPEGKIIKRTEENNIESAVQEATRRYLEHNGVVIKTEKGHAGMGVLIYKPDELKGLTKEEIEEKIRAVLLSEPYWEAFDIVVEDFVVTNPKGKGSGGGFPNAEFEIVDGKARLLYVCGMRVKDGVFQGVEIGKDVLSPKISQDAAKVGNEIANILIEGGYDYGHFDADFVLEEIAPIAPRGTLERESADQKERKRTLFLSESNVRYTGGSHAFHGAKALLGEEFNEKYIVAINIFHHKNLQGKTFEQLQNILQPIEYDPKTKTGLVIVSQALLSQGKFGYMVIADSKKEALAIEERMVRELNEATSFHKVLKLFEQFLNLRRNYD